MQQKTKKKTRKELLAKIRMLDASLASTYHFASAGIKKLGHDRLMGSGVVVRIETLSGGEACNPFMVVDGFSEETIEALRADIIRSYNQATSLKPN